MRSKCSSQKSRSIPTGVGKTRRDRLSGERVEVHPHGCGENYEMNTDRTESLGPSPRVWGKRPERRRYILDRRSIPTGVGKTSAALSGSGGLSVHPHGCGENDGAELIAAHAYGPSPRVWGKPLRKALDRPSNRSIPTGVGKTSSPRTPAER